MSSTLFRYILWDLLRIFGITAGVLTGIMSFGGLLRPLTEHGLAPAQAMQMLVYFWPAMSTYSLPVAALFATTMVYGRLSADNEITACRAAGLSALSVATPAIVLGGIISVISFISLFFIVPGANLQVTKTVYSNIAQLVQSQIERNHRIALDQPGKPGMIIFAQSAVVLPPPSGRPNDQVVRLTSPVFVRYEDPDPSNRGKVMPPLDFFMAQTATAYISQNEETGQLLMHADLQGGLKLPRRTIGAKEQPLQVGVQSTGIYPDPIESPVRENSKFMSFTRLRELLNAPEDSRRLKTLLSDFIRDDQQDAYLKRLRDTLQKNESIRFEAGGEAYVLDRNGAPVDLRRGRLVIGSPQQPREQSARLRQISRSGQTTLEANGLLTTIRATPIETATRGESSPTAVARLHIEIDLEDAVVTVGSVTTSRSLFPREFVVPMPEHLLAFKNNRVEDYRRMARLQYAADQAPDSRSMQLERNFTKLRNSIISEMHARASFSISCLTLVMVGCALGMMFRSGNFLSAFAVSVVPAMLSILLIITGQHTCENVPWDIRGYNNPLQFGVYTIWAGNAAVTVIAVVLLGRLQRQ